VGKAWRAGTRRIAGAFDALGQCVFKNCSSVRTQKVAWWALIPVGVIVYWVVIVSGVYKSINALDLFSPVQFAYSEWLSSVGAFVVGSALFAWITYVFYRYYPASPHKPSKMVVFSLFGRGYFFVVAQ
jgi:hypothetical protein